MTLVLVDITVQRVEESKSRHAINSPSGASFRETAGRVGLSRAGPFRTPLLLPVVMSMLRIGLASMGE